MAIIKKFASYQNLINFQVFQLDKNPKSDYFRITELEETIFPPMVNILCSLQNDVNVCVGLIAFFSTHKLANH